MKWIKKLPFLNYGFVIHFEEIWTWRISLKFLKNLYEGINIPWILFCIYFLTLGSSNCCGSFKQISIFWLKLFSYFFVLENKIHGEICAEEPLRIEKSLKIIKSNATKQKRFLSGVLLCKRTPKSKGNTYKTSVQAAVFFL